MTDHIELRLPYHRSVYVARIGGRSRRYGLERDFHCVRRTREIADYNGGWVKWRVVYLRRGKRAVVGRDAPAKRRVPRVPRLDARQRGILPRLRLHALRQEGDAWLAGLRVVPRAA